MKDFKFKFIEWDGKPITKPGVYSKIPLETYHTQGICDGPSVSSSGLRRFFLDSAAHFYADWDGNPKRKKQDDKPHFVLGRAVHHLMLGEPFFAKLFAVRPDTYPSEDRKTGEITEKKWTRAAGYCAKWEADHHRVGRSVITSEDVADIRGMAERLGRNPIVRAGVLNGYIERSFIYRDEATGLWIKVRPDAIPGDSGDYADLKTTTSVKWYDLQRAIFDRGYFMQMSLIRSGCRALKLPFSTATLVFVEKTDPWCERVVAVKDNDLDRGERANRFAIDGVAACLKSGRWPGPGGDREDAMGIEMSERQQKMVDDKLKFEVA